MVAANVLHATATWGGRSTGAIVAPAPDGVLLLYEVTDPPSYFDTTVALIEGWQIFDDGLRWTARCLRPSQWLELLPARGFAEVVSLPGGWLTGRGSRLARVRRPHAGGGVAGRSRGRRPRVSSRAARRSRAGQKPGCRRETASWCGWPRRHPSEHVEVLVDFVRRARGRGAARDVGRLPSIATSG